MKAAKNVAIAVSPYLIGAALIAAPYLIVTWFGPDGLESWRAAYIAGGFGGIALEMLLAKGSIELPGLLKEKPEAPDIAPLGTFIDLGFLGRVFAGALAAPVFLILVKVLSEESINAVGNETETIAWAVIIGAASPTVWQAAKTIVETRVTGRINAVLASELEKLKKDLEEGQLADIPQIDTATSNTVASHLVPRLETLQRISASTSVASRATD